MILSRTTFSAKYERCSNEIRLTRMRRTRRKRRKAEEEAHSVGEPTPLSTLPYPLTYRRPSNRRLPPSLPRPTPYPSPAHLSGSPIHTFPFVFVS